MLRRIYISIRPNEKYILRLPEFKIHECTMYWRLVAGTSAECMRIVRCSVHRLENDLVAKMHTLAAFAA